MRSSIGKVMWTAAGATLATTWVIASRFYHWPDKVWWIAAPVTVVIYASSVPWPQSAKKKG